MDKTHEFITKARKIHGIKYDYTKTIYTGVKKKVIITCSDHGDFEQTPDDHLQTKGCKQCGIISRANKRNMGRSEFLMKAKKIHGDTYNYDEMIYTKIKEKIKIKCPKHGVFEQIADNHLQGKGCKQCGIETCHEILKSDTKKFVEKAVTIHSTKYNYDNVNYVNNHTKVIINCFQHGNFEQAPFNHINGQGCPSCSMLKTSDSLKLGNNEFIRRSNYVHNGKYNYVNTHYVNNTTPVDIVCPYHGLFRQIPANHLRGKGCKNCKFSKGETIINEYLKDLKITFETQKSFPNLLYKKHLRYDFYLPELNILIEFDGQQHFEPIEHFGGMEIFEKQKIKDNLKTKYAEEYNIILIRVRYDEDIIKKLDEDLGNYI